MKRINCAVLLGLSLGAVTSCANPPYAVAPLHEETRRGQLDAQWFTREISDGNGLQAVELTYCPLEPARAIVCRTAVVWRREQSALIETETAAPAPALPPPAH